MSVKAKVDIDNLTFVRFLLVITAFVTAVFLLWKLWPVLLLIIVSFFLALALNSPVTTLTRRLPGKSRVLATALSYSMVLSILGFFIFIAIPPIIQQTNNFISALPSYIEEISEQQNVAAELVNRYDLQDEVNDFISGAQQQSGAIAKGVGSNVVSGVSSVITAFITTVTVLVLTFLMLIEGPKWFDRLWSVYRDQRLQKRHKRLLQRMYRIVTGYVNGQVLVATIAASLASVTLLILTNFFTVPVSAVLPLGALVFFTSLIPMIGATIGAILVAIVLLFNDFSAAMIFLIYFFIYQQIENNVIQPTVQSRTVELSALMVFTSVIIGIVLLGPIGGILSIPIAGCLRVLAIDYFENRPGGGSKKAAQAVAEATSNDLA